MVEHKQHFFEYLGGTLIPDERPFFFPGSLGLFLLVLLGFL